MDDKLFAKWPKFRKNAKHNFIFDNEALKKYRKNQNKKSYIQWKIQGNYFY